MLIGLECVEQGVDLLLKITSFCIFVSGERDESNHFTVGRAALIIGGESHSFTETKCALSSMEQVIFTIQTS